MNCGEIKKWLHAYADGELDLARSLEVERHLKSCAQCAAEKNSIRALGDAMRENDLAYRAPDAVRTKIRKMNRAQEPAGKIFADGHSSRPISQSWIWKWIAAGAAALAIVTIFLRPEISDRNQLLKEAVADHVRSLQADHLTDVASTDQHTVKPWFDGKLDFAPGVKDFAGQGFPLVGGRLDYLNGRAVAALVYRRNKHFINVFIWPAKNATAESAGNHHGYSVVNCDAGGFHFCLVSDLNPAELNELAHLVAHE